MKKLVTLALLLSVGSYGLVGCGSPPPATKKTEEKKTETKGPEGEKKVEEKKTEETKPAEEEKK